MYNVILKKSVQPLEAKFRMKYICMKCSFRAAEAKSRNLRNV